MRWTKSFNRNTLGKMSAFPDWPKFVVKQKRPASGCIPTGYEMILRAAGVKNVNFTTFQDDFDLDQNAKPGDQGKNNFDSVAKAVQAKYPHVHLKKRDFPTALSMKYESIASVIV